MADLSKRDQRKSGQLTLILESRILPTWPKKLGDNSGASVTAEPLCFAKYAHNLSAHSGRGRTMHDGVANEKESPVKLRIPSDRTSPKRCQNDGQPHHHPTRRSRQLH